MENERRRAGVLDAYQQGPDAVVELVVTLVSAMAGRLETRAVRVTALEDENATLRAKLDRTRRNSRKPPSSDGPGVKPQPKSQRVRSGRQPGGQPGHAGHSLRLVEEPDEVRVQAPARGQGCGQCLDGLPALRWERRQVVAIPAIRARVIEHQAATTCCPGCGAETRGAFPPGVAAPVQDAPGVATLAVSLTQEQLLPLARTSAVLAEVCGCPVAEATLERAVADCHERVAAAEAAIKQGVSAAAVAHFDETGVTLSGTTAWLHGASTPRLTFFAVHQKRGHAAMAAIGVLAQFRGRAMPDGLTSYWQYGQCAQALCNAHQLREWTFVEEHLGQGWAKDRKGVLGAIKQAVDDARDHGVAGRPANGGDPRGARPGAWWTAYAPTRRRRWRSCRTSLSRSTTTRLHGIAG